MANFQKHGKNVHGQVLKVTSGSMFELGLWGPVDTRNNTELSVSVSPSNRVVSVKPGPMLTGQPVRVWQFRNLPAGQTLVVATDRAGLIWTQVTLDVGGGEPSLGPTTGRKYTDSPNEIEVQRTTPQPGDVVDMLMASWPVLTKVGARTLTAQFMGETGDGKYCFNWNLGNVKCKYPDKLPHMYLANVWECLSPQQADASIAKGGDLARGVEMDSSEARKHGWACKASKKLVVFSPPHYMCCFRAYPTLQDGAEKWVKHHQSIAAKEPNYVAALNAGDIDAVVTSLDKVSYFTGDRDKYAAAMKRKQAQLDQKLGPV